MNNPNPNENIKETPGLNGACLEIEKQNNNNFKVILNIPEEESFFGQFSENVKKAFTFAKDSGNNNIIPESQQNEKQIVKLNYEAPLSEVLGKFEFFKYKPEEDESLTNELKTRNLKDSLVKLEAKKNLLQKQLDAVGKLQKSCQTEAGLKKMINEELNKDLGQEETYKQKLERNFSKSNTKPDEDMQLFNILDKLKKGIKEDVQGCNEVDTKTLQEKIKQCENLNKENKESVGDFNQQVKVYNEEFEKMKAYSVDYYQIKLSTKNNFLDGLRIFFLLVTVLLSELILTAIQRWYNGKMNKKIKETGTRVSNDLNNLSSKKIDIEKILESINANKEKIEQSLPKIKENNKEVKDVLRDKAKFSEEFSANKNNFFNLDAIQKIISNPVEEKTKKKPEQGILNRISAQKKEEQIPNELDYLLEAKNNNYAELKVEHISFENEEVEDNPQTTIGRGKKEKQPESLINKIKNINDSKNNQNQNSHIENEQEMQVEDLSNEVY